MEKRRLSSTEVAASGMINNHEQMENGELRFRLRNENDGSGYVRIVAGTEGAWQNAHFHTGVRECVIVQKGWMAFAKKIDGGIHMRILREEEMIVSEPGVVHNTYLPVGAIIHCVKFGSNVAEKISGKADWHSSPEFDKLTKSLSEYQIMFRANQC